MKVYISDFIFECHDLRSMEFQAVNACDRHAFRFGTIYCFLWIISKSHFAVIQFGVQKDIRNFEISKKAEVSKMIKKFARGIWKNFWASFQSSFSLNSSLNILWQELSPLDKRCVSAFHPRPQFYNKVWKWKAWVTLVFINCFKFT